MNILGYEIRRAVNQPSAQKTGGFFGGQTEAPTTNVDMYYKYYRKNSDVRRCVKEHQDSIGSDGYFFMSGEDVATDASYTAVMEYGKGRRTLKNKIIRDLLIGGNAYIVRLLNDSGVLIGLDTIDPRTVRVRADEYGDVLAYEQFVNGGVVNTYTPDEIVNCYDDLDPDNEIFGLSTLEGIIIEILSDSESSLMNYHYFKNNAIPSMILTMSDDISDAEMTKVMSQMKKNFSGGKNKHKIGMLRGISGIEKMQDSVADMQFEVMRGFNTNRVCSAFGVPKVMLGYTDGVNYTNADMQFKKFIEQTAAPFEKRVEKRINEALQTEDLVFHIVDTTFEINKEKIDIIESKMRNGLITANEARAELGYEPYEGIDEADQPLISKSYDKLVDVGLSDIFADET